LIADFQLPISDLKIGRNLSSQAAT